MVKKHKDPKGVCWIVEGSIESYYRTKEYEAKQYKAGDAFLQYHYLGKSPLLTYQAKQRTVVLVAPIDTLNSLFEKYVYDRFAFEHKAKQELDFMIDQKKKLKDIFFSCILDFNISAYT